MSDTATLKIWRGQSKVDGHWETHAVPFERGQSVLDGLRWIRVHKDPSLAIRFSCINANACKECMMELDGETVLCLHRAARAARDDRRAAARTRRWCAIWSPRSRRPPNALP
jgi:succinate dehydrogenase/fumarate reductase-like Fe-S protein